MPAPLLLVDGHNLLARAAFGFPARIIGGGGRDITGPFGFLALLRKACRFVADEVGEAEVVVLFDSETSIDARRAADPTFKAHRPVIPTLPVEWITPLASVLGGTGVRALEVDGAEADDAMATLVRRARGRRTTVLLATDRDLHQLLDDDVLQLNTLRPPGRRLYGPPDVLERFGVEPRQWCDFTALVGDPSDGLPGVRGVGRVGAAALLAGGARLEDLPGLGRLEGRWGRLVAASLPDALRQRELHRLRTDVPLPLRLRGAPSPTLPLAARLVDRMGLW